MTLLAGWAPTNSETQIVVVDFRSSKRKPKANETESELIERKR